MATVIDSLLIELGLDTSKFDIAQKKSVEQLRKFDDQQVKTSKNTQQGAKNTAEGFEKAKDALIAFGTTFVGMKSFTNFTQDITKTNAALGRTAGLFGMSATELNAWGGVLKSVGGDAGSFQSSMQAMQQGIAAIKLGDASILTPLARLGALGSIDVNKGTVDIYKLSDALKRFKEAYGQQPAYTLAQQLGIDQPTFMVLQQGADAVRKLYDESFRLSGVTEKNIKAAQELQAVQGVTAQAMSKAGNAIMNELYPALEVVSEATTFALEKFVEWNEELDGLIAKVAIFAGGLISLQGAISSLKLFGITAGEGLVGGMVKLFGAAGSLFYSQGLNKGEDEQFAAENLPRNVRNNNPGNLEYGDFAKSNGATGSDGRFAIFPDMKTGENAMANLLMNYAKGGINTISSIINKWSPGSEKGNNPSSYIDSISKSIGIDPNKPLTPDELIAVQKAMTYVEGNTKGNISKNNEGNFGKTLEQNAKQMVGAGNNTPLNSSSNSNVETNIGTINIQTQATTSDGIVRDLSTSLNNNSLINSGITGNR